METEHRKNEFSDVDQFGGSDYFVNFLDALARSDYFVQLKQRTREMLNLRGGSYVLDVGCGTGDDVRGLASIVAPTGLAVGIDRSKSLIAEAVRRTSSSDLRTAFCVGDARSLPFDDNSFDGCRAERVLQHITDPYAVIAEMVRVAKPGMRIVVFDADWDTLVVDAPDNIVTRKIMAFRTDDVVNGTMGRQLYRLFKQAGLIDIEIIPLPRVFTDYAEANDTFSLAVFAHHAQEAGFITRDEADTWVRQLQELGEAGLFFAVHLPFLASGRKAPI